MKPAIHSLPLLKQGKVRDLYAVDEKHVLIVASDRLSCFDVVLPDEIPGKGAVLTQVSNFWFGKTRNIIRNHLTGITLDEVLAATEITDDLRTRSVVARKLTPLPLEAIVRGYLAGSGWKDYCMTGSVCGIALPAQLQLAQKLPQPLFTPSTKAAAGEHDTNMTFAMAENLIGEELAEKVREVSLELYRHCAACALERKLIIADTKLEFAVSDNGELVLIDELLTPDSSRFWSCEDYRPGISLPGFDKQFVRDYLEETEWNKQPPGPRLPPEIIAGTTKKYQRLQDMLLADPS